VLAFFSYLDWLLNFSGTMIAAVYFCIGLGALRSRVSMKHAERPFRMPLWPFPPLFVVAFTGFALYSQDSQYLIGEAVLIATGIVLWRLSARWSRRAR
jgi:amino acid transporter